MVTSTIYSQTDTNDYIDFTKINSELNSDLFKIDTVDNEQILILTGNSYNQEIDEFTGKKKDDARGGKIILFDETMKNYTMTVDMKFLGFHVEGAPRGGWFGFTARAQDFENFELVWFMPNADEANTVAYVPVAHGVVPWWTEAYASQEKGSIALPKNDWFTARVDVIGDEISVYVNDQFLFKKKLTYYLTTGKAGLFVGTATDAAFRRLMIKKID